MLAGVDRELLTKRKLDDRLFTLTAKQGWDRGRKDGRAAAEGSDHVAILNDRVRTIQTESRWLFSVA